MFAGANAGIGKETARDLYKRGARVIMLCRSLERAAAAAVDIRADGSSGSGSSGSGRLVVQKLDLASLDSVRECARNLLEKEDKLDILVNNAGMLNFNNRELTADGFETTFATNHLGHFLLTELLMPLIKKSAAAASGFRSRY